MLFRRASRKRAMWYGDSPRSSSSLSSVSVNSLIVATAPFGFLSAPIVECPSPCLSVKPFRSLASLMPDRSTSARPRASLDAQPRGDRGKEGTHPLERCIFRWLARLHAVPNWLIPPHGRMPCRHPAVSTPKCGVGRICRRMRRDRAARTRHIGKGGLTTYRCSSILWS